MYHFRIIKQLDGGYRFELGDIKMFIDNYNVVNDKHRLTNPGKAIAYFNMEDSIYGISNEPYRYSTAEEFFDVISQQYKMFSLGSTQNKKNDNQQYA